MHTLTLATCPSRLGEGCMRKVIPYVAFMVYSRARDSCCQMRPYFVSCTPKALVVGSVWMVVWAQDQRGSQQDSCCGASAAVELREVTFLGGEGGRRPSSKSKPYYVVGGEQEQGPCLVRSCDFLALTTDTRTSIHPLVLTRISLLALHVFLLPPAPPPPCYFCLPPLRPGISP